MWRVWKRTRALGKSEERPRVGQPRKAEKMTDDKVAMRPLAGDWPRPLGFLLALVAWAAFGFLFGTHWWVLFFVAARTPADRRACVLHFLLHLAALLITAIGGGWCRASGAYIACADNNTMTRSCLWSTQPLDYRVIYTIHFISGGMLLVMGVLDPLQLPGWTLRRTPLTTLYTQYRLAPAYASVLAVATLCVTLTWTVIGASATRSTHGQQHQLICMQSRSFCNSPSSLAALRSRLERRHAPRASGHSDRCHCRGRRHCHCAAQPRCAAVLRRAIKVDPGIDHCSTIFVPQRP